MDAAVYITLNLKSRFEKTVVLEKCINLPFLPSHGLTVKDGGIYVRLGVITYNIDLGIFTTRCEESVSTGDERDDAMSLYEQNGWKITEK